MGGDKFDDAITKYMKKQHNLIIGERTAEKVKMEIGSAFKREEEKFMKVTGRNQITGLPCTVEISSAETLEALDECVEKIKKIKIKNGMSNKKRNRLLLLWRRKYCSSNGSFINFSYISFNNVTTALVCNYLCKR